MGGTSLQFLLTLILLLLCMKPTIANYLGLADTHLGCKEHERQALLKIKQDLIDDDGLLSSWSSDQDCCTWRGVKCSNQTGHVFMLNINFSDFLSAPLRGKLNPSLIELKYLTYLDVSNNDFNYSQIPEFIASLSNVRHLDLSYANFGRNIPFQLGNLSSLQYLDLGYNNFNSLKNLEWLPQLSSLKYLDMSTVNLSKVNNWLHVVNKLPYLTSLSLCYCNLPNIFSIPLVNSSASLDTLDLSDNYLTSASSVLEWLFNSNTSVVALDLSYNQFQGLIPDGFSRIISLAELYFYDNEFEGGIPKSFGGMCNLKTLSLSVNNLSGQLLGIFHNLTGCSNHSIERLDFDWNRIMGSLPDIITFPSLRKLRLESNLLKGIVPESLGKQSNLETLFLAGNSLEGVISEAHFSNLTKLKHLALSNPLVFNFSFDWVPPFQLEVIRLGSCQIGPLFPAWLQTQTNYFWIDISNSGISDVISNSDWIFSPQIQYMNLSFNQISGQIPNLSLEFTSSPTIDFSSNKLKGGIPKFLFESAYLDLSKNMLSGPIFSLCEVQNGNLNFLDLSNNRLSGQFPDSCWMQLKGLQVLNLANNHFHGKIPSSVGFLRGIVSLDLSNNNFSGEIPSSLNNCKELIFLNLGDNALTGQIPMWLGTSYTNLIILVLRSNHFNGSIPIHLCRLAHLQVLDLALNQILGSIPKCLNNLHTLTQKDSPNATIAHSSLERIGGLGYEFSYIDHVFFMWKGKEYEFKNILGLLKSIDLSSNNLTGQIPGEIVKLVGLVSLNLSRNRLTGQITSEIDMLQSLDFLDLSKNQLSGGIPLSLSHIDRLSVLDLSNNNLSGKIPTSPQLDTFNASSYEGNPNLCGAPLPKKCSGEEIAQNPAMNGSREHAGVQDEKEGFISIGFYVSVALGFITGFWGVVGTLVLNMSLRVAFFRFLNDFKDRLYVAISVNLARVQRQLQNQLISQLPSHEDGELD